MDKKLSFDKDMLLIQTVFQEGTSLFERKGVELRPLAKFYFKDDAVSILTMAKQLNFLDRVINSLKEELNDVHVVQLTQIKQQLADSRKQLELITTQRHELLTTLKGIIDGCTMEHAEYNGWGPQRMKVSEVYDRIMWGKPNEGGAQ